MTSDEQAGLKQEIERTREQLGETVEALAAKADVKAQARAKAAHVTGRLRSRTAQARQQAAGAAKRLSTVTPDPVRRVAVKTAATGRDRRVQLVTAAGAVVLVWLLIARWRRR
jgi:hypothetical protein